MPEILSVRGFLPLLDWTDVDLLLNGVTSRGAYVEAITHGTVIHAEGDTLAEAEEACHARLMAAINCPAGPEHGPFERGEYTNGAATCTSCGTWFPSKLPPLPGATPADVLLDDVLGGRWGSVLDILSAVHDTPADSPAHTPVGVHRQRTKGWTAPENTVMVDRTSKRWGNPYDWRTMGAQAAVDAYAAALDTVLAGVLRGDDDDQTRELWARFAGPDDARYQLNKLRGKNLGCPCKLGSPCHRDVLLARANQIASR